MSVHTAAVWMISNYSSHIYNSNTYLYICIYASIVLCLCTYLCVRTYVCAYIGICRTYNLNSSYLCYSRSRCKNFAFTIHIYLCTFQVYRMLIVYVCMTVSSWFSNFIEDCIFFAFVAKQLMTTISDFSLTFFLLF